MQKRRIGIDIDATLTNYDKFMIEAAKKYYPDREIDLTEYDCSKQFKLTTPEEKSLFFSTVFQDYLVNAEIFDGASELIKELHKKYEIFIITNRGYSKGKENLKEQKITKTWLEQHNVEYDAIHFNLSTEDKSKFINELGIDLLIDDAEFQIRKIRPKCPDVKFLVHTTLSNANFLSQYTSEELPRFTYWNKYTLELINNILR